MIRTILTVLAGAAIGVFLAGAVMTWALLCGPDSDVLTTRSKP